MIEHSRNSQELDLISDRFSHMVANEDFISWVAIDPFTLYISIEL